MGSKSIKSLASVLGPFLQLPKVIAFAVVGALGALMGAIVGEFFLPGDTGAVAPTEKQVISLCLDVSASMIDGNRLAEAKKAAAGFARKKTAQGIPVGVVAFGAKIPESLSVFKGCQNKSDVEAAAMRYTGGSMVKLQELLEEIQRVPNAAWVVVDPTSDRSVVEESIFALDAMGNTPMHGGLKTSREQLAGQDGKQWVLLFTDGMPDSEADAISSAGLLREYGINLVAVGTGTCNRDFLERLTGSPDTVFMASDGEFGMAFAKAEERMGSLVSSAGGSSGASAIHVGIWTACVAAGLLLLLVGAQNLYLMRSAYTPGKFARGLVGGLLIGFASGAVAQVLYSIVGGGVESGFILDVITRTPGWALFGLLIALGMTWFIANMARFTAMGAGAVGGVAGSFAYIVLSSAAGDTTGRLAGALVIGAVIGFIIAWVEMISTRMWLEIVWPDGQRRRVNLGDTPVHIGKAGKQHSGSENIQILGAMDDVQYDFSIEQTPEGPRCKCSLANDGATYLATPGEEFEMLTKDYKSAKIRICGR